ncbi:MAG: rhodanese-like domain-containing protein [Anaerolineae bacterium]
MSRKLASRRQRSSSLVIPALVGIVMVILLGGVLLSMRNQKPRAAISSERFQLSSGTEAALPTRALPYPSVPRIPLQEALAKLQQGQAVLVDVRSRAAYDQAHAAGALSFPEEEMDARLDELPRDKEWILY